MPVPRRTDAGAPAEVVALDATHLEAWARLRALAFGGPIDADGLARLRVALPHTRGVVQDGRLTACATMLPLQVFVAHRRVRAGGLAAVASAPEARRRGMVRALLADGLQRLREAGVGWCLEYPFDPAFYARYGFQSVPNGRVLELPIDRLFHGAPAPARPIGPGEEERVRAIHREYASRHHFALSREDDARDHWGRVHRPPWAAEARYGYLLDDAYVFLSLERSDDGTEGERVRLEARDLAFGSPAGREALLAFLGSFQGQVESVRLHLPDADPLVLDWGARHARRTNILQARLVDLGAALAPFTAPRARAVTLHLADGFCAWNQGTFRLGLGPNGTTVERSGDAPDVRLDVATLTLLVIGGWSAADALDAGRATGEREALEAIAALAAGATSFVPEADHF